MKIYIEKLQENDILEEKRLERLPDDDEHILHLSEDIVKLGLWVEYTLLERANENSQKKIKFTLLHRVLLLLCGSITIWA